MSTLAERTVVITGVSRGLGRALAIAFAEHGAVVHGTGRDEAALAETAAALAQCGATYELTQLELTDDAAATAYIAAVPRIDILVNNAGIARAGPFLDTPVAELREVLAVNVVAPFLLMRGAAARMCEQGGGQIINIASDAALRGIPGMGPYTASKHALLGLGRSVARELRSRGVRVTTYCPGPICTEIIGRGNPDALRPEHVAANVVHLAMLPPEMEVRELLVEPMKLDIP